MEAATPAKARMAGCQYACLPACVHDWYWAARYNTGLVIILTPKGVVFSLLFLFFFFA